MESKYLQNVPSNTNSEVFTISEPKTKRYVTKAEPADFETAIAATKFGKFNILLFILAIPSGWASPFETTTMSYVFPAAQCDLDLSLYQKGSLNAITFVGMVTSGFAWGFLCDTLGRKKLMVFGYLFDSLFVIISAFSQNYTVLVISKFFGGFIINGPFAAFTAYLSEFHGSKYRTRVQMLRGIIVSCGMVTLPLLAWAILPRKTDFYLFNNLLVLHSWNVYLLICAIPSLLSGITWVFMPESPKFLMSVGRNAEALEIFRKVFALNTGKSKTLYPIKELVDETAINASQKHGGHVTANRNKVQALKEGFQQIKPLFFAPFVKNFFLVCTVQSLLMFSVNTIRLWLPQIFQAISDYQLQNNGSSSNLCTMLAILRPQNTNQDHDCQVNLSSTVYRNAMIVSGFSISGYFIAATIINKLGKKILLGGLSLIAGTSAMSMYFSQNTATVLALSTMTIAFGGICGNVLLSAVIDLFPTTLRTVTISLVLITGRSATMIGNFIFPLLLQLGCAPPFFSIGIALIGCSILTVLLPNTDLQPLQ